MINNYQGQMEPPDQIVDPIGYHLWYEANKCPDCNGTGKWYPQSCFELFEGNVRQRDYCEGCQGNGVRPELSDPDF